MAHGALNRMTQAPWETKHPAIRYEVYCCLQGLADFIEEHPTIEVEDILSVIKKSAQQVKGTLPDECKTIN